ncbi:hypothetical protein GA0115234_100686 [Streptomyces sp. DvalAA-43]|nr:hypothetical protein GA0115234_100686 [Streptomyces sp. DvalAA-43]
MRRAHEVLILLRRGVGAAPPALHSRRRRVSIRQYAAALAAPYVLPGDNG